MGLRLRKKNADGTTTGTLPTWAVALIATVAAIAIFMSLYITLIKWKALAKDPRALRDVALAQVAGNAFSQIANRQSTPRFSTFNTFRR